MPRSSALTGLLHYPRHSAKLIFCSGGLGLTGGIADVGSLYECLGGIHTERADDSILDQYSDIRRKIWSDIIDPVSSDNIRRLFDQDPDKAAENDPFLGMCQRTEKDREFSIEFQSVSLS